MHKTLSRPPRPPSASFLHEPQAQHNPREEIGKETTLHFLSLPSAFQGILEVWVEIGKG